MRFSSFRDSWSLARLTQALKGAAFLRDLRTIMGEAATAAKKAPASSETSHRRTAAA